MKTYTSKSNAARAAKPGNGGNLDGLTLFGEAGAYYYAKAEAPATPAAPPAPAARRLLAALPKLIATDGGTMKAPPAPKAPADKPAKKAAKKAAAKKAPVKRGTGNTYENMRTKHMGASTIESPVWVVWDTCDNMPKAKRKEVIQACVDKGVSYYTARTQYQAWKSASSASK